MQNIHITSPRTRFLRRAIPAAIAVGFAAVAVLTLTRTVTANDDGRRVCGNRTLRGDYGILVSGIRGAGPGQTEQFVGTALRTYDGHGGFSQVDNSHGQLTGARRDVPATGTVRSQRRLHGDLAHLLSRGSVSRRDSLRHRRWR